MKINSAGTGKNARHRDSFKYTFKGSYFYEASVRNHRGRNLEPQALVLLQTQVLLGQFTDNYEP